MTILQSSATTSNCNFISHKMNQQKANIMRVSDKTNGLQSTVESDLNFLRECSTEHESLPGTSWRHCILLHNTPDLRLKAHVQHTISLVQHQVAAHIYNNTLIVTFINVTNTCHVDIFGSFHEF